MSLTTKFREAAIEQSLGRNTVSCYAHWHRQFYAFCKLPAARWDGELVRRWMLGHEDLNTTAIYLHADAARGFSPLDVPAPKAFLS